jgi:hypothetical protein
VVIVIKTYQKQFPKLLKKVFSEVNFIGSLIIFSIYAKTEQIIKKANINTIAVCLMNNALKAKSKSNRLLIILQILSALEL